MLLLSFSGYKFEFNFIQILIFLQDRILERLKQMQGSQVDLPPREDTIRKFSNHCRLWIGNLPLDITEEDVRELFKPYGEFDEVYFDKNKGFAFVRMVSFLFLLLSFIKLFLQSNVIFILEILINHS